MNKFESFSDDEVIVLANSLAGECRVYKGLFGEGVVGSGEVLNTITNMGEELLLEIKVRKAVVLAELDQLLESLNDSDN